MATGSVCFTTLVRASRVDSEPPNRQMQLTGRVGVRFHPGGTIGGCHKEALICVGAGSSSLCG
jgi:hypothetical protein